ncbi:MAG: ferredoxin family protein [Candidatus Bathyarchaeota archaeon]|nr:ferredoxin family protein [Candidatus Bathyarchaeota archaeon]
MGKIVVDEEVCKGCTLCIGACPFNLIQIAKRINSKGYFPAEFVDDSRKCTGCTLCAIMCPDMAIEVYREKKTGGKK